MRGKDKAQMATIGSKATNALKTAEQVNIENKILKKRVERLELERDEEKLLRKRTLKQIGWLIVIFSIYYDGIAFFLQPTRLFSLRYTEGLGFAQWLGILAGLGFVFWASRIKNETISDD